MSQQSHQADLDTLNLDAYLDRIGHAGDRAPTLATLAELHLLHPRAIPFENLDPFLGRPVELGLGALQRKLVTGRRGGYCFEHNLLFMEVLRALGFEVRGLAARVLWGRSEGTLTPRGHMLLLVHTAEGEHIADVGFGGLTQTAPLAFTPGKVQKTPHERFRVTQDDGYFRIAAEAGGEWRPLYRFDLSEHFVIDYGVTSHFLSTHPASQFVTGLLAARALPGRRLALAGNRFAIHHAGSATERREIETADELAALLETAFGIDLPDRALFEDTARRKAIVPA